MLCRNAAPPYTGIDEERLRIPATFSLGAMLKAIFILGTLGRNGTSATPMQDLFRGGIP